MEVVSPRDNCPTNEGGCPWWVVVIGLAVLGGVIVLLGICPWGSCPQGSCPRGSCPRGSCPRGSCPTIYVLCFCMVTANMHDY